MTGSTTLTAFFEQLHRWYGDTPNTMAPLIGYDKAAEIVKEAASSGRSLREIAREKGVEESVLDEALDYRAMAKPHG